MRGDVWLVIAGMAVATYLTRAPLLLVLAHRPLPPWLRLIPLAVLPALAIPMILVERDAGAARLAVWLGHPPLWGAIVVFALAAVRVNLLVTVAVGVAVVAFLRTLA